ncbi:MAG: FAD-dependent oxidoreductase [Propionibacteriaceae bacterium]|jgi:phytoene dehydrogenase-like protein|nr:FAD-dependent oxidoreductase [Propionibacteriaceae bacterium]
MPSEPLTLAVVGSGAAGTLAAWRLRARLGPRAAIHVFDKEPQVGGRAHHIQFAGQRIELGGTLIHTDNRRLIELAHVLGVQLAPRRVDVLGGADQLAVWTGREFLVRAPESGIGLPLALVRRFGPVNLLRLQSLAKRAKAAWNSTYALQEAGRIFETPEELIRAAGLRPYIGVSLADLAATRHISRKLVDEFVTPVLRDMYNQTSDIVAFAGLVGLAGAGLAGGSLVSVVDGNATLLEKALAQIVAEVHLSTTVTAVEPSDDGVWLTAGGQRTRFDAVVLAAPLELAGVDLPGVDLPDLHRRHQEVHVTLVAAEADPAFFGGGPVPVDVLTTNGPDTVFKAFAQTGHSRSLGVPIWKFFSGQELDDAFLARVFRRVEDVHRHLWQAYPVLDPAPRFRPFRLAQGVYQINDFESAVSTLETDGTVGWSVADLVVRDLEAV